MISPLKWMQKARWGRPAEVLPIYGAELLRLSFRLLRWNLRNHFVLADLAIGHQFARRPIFDEQFAKRVHQNSDVGSKRVISGVKELESQFRWTNQFFVGFFWVFAAL